MKKPWTIGLLSIIPGMGLIVLGEIRQGFVAAIIVVFLAFLGILAPWQNVSLASFTLGIIAWGSQWYYAIIAAQRLARTEAGLTPQVRQPLPMPPAPPETSYRQRLLHKVKQSVMQLLLPGEHLRVAVMGQVGAPSPIEVILTGGVAATGFTHSRIVYLGITEHDFILVRTDQLGKPEELQRLSLDQVKLVESREGLLDDEVVIDIGETKPLRVQVGRVLRHGTRQLMGILSS